jgi:D-hydroxyproline dehydrogenase subunit beta
MTGPYDLAVVGAGILGLAHAYAAARRGKRVVVIERDTRAVGASIRNFGFVTVTGQGRGESWRRARRTRDVWNAVAHYAGIPVEHVGLLLTLRRPESVRVAEAFLETEMSEGCALLDRAELLARLPQAEATAATAALWSPHDLRVESRTAIPRLAAYLAEHWKVDFRFDTAVLDVDPPRIRTSRGALDAGAAIVCPGDDFATLFPERIAAYRATKCRLSMLRLAAPGFRLPAALMSDLGLTRYPGYAALPEAAALRARLEAEQPTHLRHGVHLIAVQSADGSLVVGDSHHYDATPDPFAQSQTEDLILDELREATGIARLAVTERWTGVYASSSERAMFVDAPSVAIRIVFVTGGNGASTAFAIGEEVVRDIFKDDFEGLS